MTNVYYVVVGLTLVLLSSIGLFLLGWVLDVLCEIRQLLKGGGGSQ